MKKLTIILVGIFVLGHSFVMAERTYVSSEQIICTEKGGKYTTSGCELGGNIVQIGSGEILEFQKKNEILGKQRIELIEKMRIACQKKGYNLEYVNERSYLMPKCPVDIDIDALKNTASSRNPSNIFIISTLVVLIGIGLVITGFHLRKLNQKNEKPLPPQP